MREVEADIYIFRSLKNELLDIGYREQIVIKKWPCVNKINDLDYNRWEKSGIHFLIFTRDEQIRDGRFLGLDM